jgi:type IV pilus biogenesis protein CpaD/CtpE
VPFTLPTPARRLLSGATLLLAAACGDDPVSPAVDAGTYTATTFRVTPTGEQEIDILAQGGALSITIESSNVTSGTLNMPASTTGGAAFVASMAGTVVREGSTVRFEQSADSFVRDLDWTAQGGTLSVTNQALPGATWTITLTRQ